MISTNALGDKLPVSVMDGLMVAFNAAVMFFSKFEQILSDPVTVKGFEWLTAAAGDGVRAALTAFCAVLGFAVCAQTRKHENEATITLEEVIDNAATHGVVKSAHADAVENHLLMISHRRPTRTGSMKLSDEVLNADAAAATASAAAAAEMEANSC